MVNNYFRHAVRRLAVLALAVLLVLAFEAVYVTLGTSYALGLLFAVPIAMLALVPLGKPGD